MNNDKTVGSAGPVARGAWFTLVVLFLIYVFHYTDRAVFSIVLEPLKHEFALSDSQLGSLTGVIYALTYSLAGIPLGILVDRVSRKRLLAGLLLIWSGATAFCGLAQGYWQLVAARFVVGAAESGGSPASLSMIGDLFPKSQRGAALGFYWASLAAGTALTFILGGWVAQLWGWRAAFFLAGGPGLALACILLLFVREPIRGAMDDPNAAVDRAPDVIGALREAARQPTFIPVYVAMSFNSVVGSGIFVWIVSFLVRTQGLSLREGGLYAGLAAAICGIAGTYYGGVFSDRIAQHNLSRVALLPAITSLIASMAVLGMAAAPSALIAVAAYALFELSYRTYLGPGYHLLLTPLTSHTRGLASSAMQFSINLIGWGLGPLVVGSVSDHIGGPQSLRAGVAVLAAVNVCAAAAYVVTWRRGERHVEL